MAEALGLTTDAGVVLSDVLPGSPAEKAGLAPGDLVLSLDGKPMENGRQFRINVYTRGVGEQVAVEVRRGARTLTVRVPVVERENGAGQLEALIGTQQVIRTLGIIGLDLTPAIAPRCLDRYAATKGLSSRGSRRKRRDPQQGRLQPGDVPLCVERKERSRESRT